MVQITFATGEIFLIELPDEQARIVTSLCLEVTEGLPEDGDA